MNITQTGQVLTTIQAYTNRNVDAATIQAWHVLLEPYGVEDCLLAVQDHYRVTSDWLMPSDLIGRVRAIRGERLAKFQQALRLSDADEQDAIESGTYRVRQAQLQSLAADGILTPDAHAAYVDGRMSLTEAVAQRAELSR